MAISILTRPLSALGTASPGLVIVLTLLVVLVLHRLLTVVYNIYFHPLSKFPGSRLAAAGSYYEFYFDVVRDGTYLWEIDRMHDEYGPIIRVNHRELHVRDPAYYSTIYAGQGHRINKDAAAVAAFTVPTATLATVDHDIHRLRRSIVAPFFSKRSVNRTEPIINERISRLIHHLRSAHDSNVIVDLDSAYAALTADIITTYFYGQNFSYLDRPSFKFPMRDAIQGLIGFYHITRFLPTLAAGIKSLPIPLVRLIQSGAADLLVHQREIRAVLSSSTPEPAGMDIPSAVVIAALGDEKIPPEERSIERLVDEGTTIIFAGTETTARALSVATFYIFQNAAILTRLRAELAPVFAAHVSKYKMGEPGREDGGVPPSTDLEKLPYLAGCINEGLRLSHGPIVRLPRCAEVPLSYTVPVVPPTSRSTGKSLGQDRVGTSYIIPPRTPVSQSTLLMHLNPSIFPDPYTFNPDRWIRDGKLDVALGTFICSFTKGTRQCLGINMAYAEMFLTISRVVMAFELDMRGLTFPSDIEVKRARLTGFPERGNGEVRVRVSSVR